MYRLQEHDAVGLFTNRGRRSCGVAARPVRIGCDMANESSLPARFWMPGSKARQHCSLRHSKRSTRLARLHSHSLVNSWIAWRSNRPERIAVVQPSHAALLQFSRHKSAPVRVVQQDANWPVLLVLVAGKLASHQQSLALNVVASAAGLLKCSLKSAQVWSVCMHKCDHKLKLTRHDLFQVSVLSLATVQGNATTASTQRPKCFGSYALSARPGTQLSCPMAPHLKTIFVSSRAQGTDVISSNSLRLRLRLLQPSPVHHQEATRPLQELPDPHLPHHHHLLHLQLSSRLPLPHPLPSSTGHQHHQQAHPLEALPSLSHLATVPLPGPLRPLQPLQSHLPQ